MNSRIVCCAAALLAIVTVLARPVAEAEPDPVMPGDFVALRDVEPSILQEMRYATPHNFTGAPVVGYLAPACILTRPAAEVHNRIRGLSPFPGAWFELVLNGQPTRVKALRAQRAADTLAPGALGSNLTLGCADGAVRITEVQREGKGVMDAATFLRGAGVLPPRVS